MLKKILKITAIVLLSLIVAALLLCGSITKLYVESNSEQLIGRRVEIGSMGINPLSGTIYVENFKIFEKDALTPFADFADMRLNFSVAALASNRIELNRLRFNALNISIEQDGNNYNFSDIVEKFNQSNNSANKWKVLLKNIEIANSSLKYHDRQSGKTIQLNKIGVDIPKISPTEREGDAGIKLKFAESGELRAKMEYNSKNLFKLEVQLQKFGVDGILPYLKEYLNVSKAEGEINANLTIVGDSRHIAESTIKGDVECVKSLLKDSDGKKIFAADSVTAYISGLNVGKHYARMEHLYISSPYAKIVRHKDSTLNLSLLIKDLNEEDEQHTQSGDGEYLFQNMALNINKLHITNGKIDIKDELIDGGFEYAISEIEASCNNFSLTEKNKIEIKAIAGNAAEIDMSWQSDFNKMNQIALTLNAKNMGLKDFSPYSSYYTGYKIERGVMNLQASYSIINKQISGTNSMQVYKPKLGKKRGKPLYDVPLKLGVYLLTNKQGMMKLNFTVEGDTDNPEYNYRKLITKAFFNAIKRVSTAPFRAIGSIFAASENLEELKIEPFKDDIDLVQYAKLEKIIELAKEKPEAEYEFRQFLYLNKILKQNPGVMEEEILALAESRNENLKKFLKRMDAPKSVKVAPFNLKEQYYYKGDNIYTITASIKE